MYRVYSVMSIHPMARVSLKPLEAQPYSPRPQAHIQTLQPFFRRGFVITVSRRGFVITVYKYVVNTAVVSNNWPKRVPGAMRF
jgi:hypothetical protein